MESPEVEIIDCGQAKLMTQGGFFGLYMEGAIPPFSYCLRPYQCQFDVEPQKPVTDSLDALRAEYEAHEGLKKHS